MTPREFRERISKSETNFDQELFKFLKSIQFGLERQGKLNATEDFYQATTRSGNVRDYPLTGRLRSSINSRLKRTTKGINITLQAGGSVGGAVVDYADDLEFGTTGIKPYFFLGRTIKAEEKSIRKDLFDFLQLQLIGE